MFSQSAALMGGETAEEEAFSCWLQSRSLVWLIVAILLSGCTYFHQERLPTTSPHSVPATVPRELYKASLPDYIIEPPDIVSIEAVSSLVPKPPYKLRPFDVITVNVLGTPSELPIQGPFTVEPDGTIDLGIEYGSVPIGGRTVDEAETELQAYLGTILAEPQVSIKLQQLAGVQNIAGEHLVQPDGRVNLGNYGRVRVVGQTIEQATNTIEEHLSQHLVEPDIAVDVFAFNSKVYYIIAQGGGLGDQVVSFPVKGNETVLDALAQIRGLSETASSRIWIARPGGNRQGGDQILPVDWLAISQRGAVGTNYQIFPGDRIYVAHNKLVAFDNALAKFIAPWERIMGFSLLGRSTVGALNAPLGGGVGLLGAGGGIGTGL